MSVVIPAYNCVDAIGDQLDALDRQRYLGQWEIIFADNGSTDGTKERLQTWAQPRHHVRVVDASSRRGAAHARNVGCAASHAKVLLFTDADDVIGDGWVAALAPVTAGQGFAAGVDVDSLEELRHVGVHRTHIPATTKSYPFLPIARGGNMGLRADVFDVVGCWNEDLTRGQDSELAWRIQVSGYALQVVPEARVWYRRPTALTDLMRHQYRFGRQAPSLYRSFEAHGAPALSLSREVALLTSLAARAPLMVVSSKRRRRRFLLGVAGCVGRVVGLIQLRRESRGPRGRGSL